MKADLSSLLDTQHFSFMVLQPRVELETSKHLRERATTTPCVKQTLKRSAAGRGSRHFTVCKKKSDCGAGSALSAVTTAPFSGLCTAQCHGNANQACLCCFFAFRCFPLPLSSSAKQQPGDEICPFCQKVWDILMARSVLKELAQVHCSHLNPFPSQLRVNLWIKQNFQSN